MWWPASSAFVPTPLAPRRLRELRRAHQRAAAQNPRCGAERETVSDRAPVPFVERRLHDAERRSEERSGRPVDDVVEQTDPLDRGLAPGDTLPDALADPRRRGRMLPARPSPSLLAAEPEGGPLRRSPRALRRRRGTRPRPASAPHFRAGTCRAGCGAAARGRPRRDRGRGSRAAWRPAPLVSGGGFAGPRLPSMPARALASRARRAEAW